MIRLGGVLWVVVMVVFCEWSCSIGGGIFGRCWSVLSYLVFRVPFCVPVIGVLLLARLVP